MIYCGCFNCQTLNKWEAVYKKFLENYPSQENKEWIEGLKKTERKILICFKKNQIKNGLNWSQAV